MAQMEADGLLTERLQHENPNNLARVLLGEHFALRDGSAFGACRFRF
jgi:hypothetical protein